MSLSYQSFYRRVVLPMHCLLRRRSTLRWYDTVTRQQRFSVDELAALQRRKLAALVRYCAQHVPYYRDQLGRRGVDPQCVEDISILREAGVRLDKEVVRTRGDELLAIGSKQHRLYSVSTGGSTGVPLCFYRSMDTVCRRQALKFRAEEWIGKPIGTRTSLIWGRLPPKHLHVRAGRSLYWWYQNYQFLSAFDIGPERLAEYVALMTRFGTEFIESYVTAIHQMAKVIAARKLRVPPRLRGIVVGAEELIDEQRAEIEASFGCPVYNRYGSSEFTNIASECALRQGMHINADHILIEVVDDDDRPVVDQVGEIVVTDLDNYDMPLIRYRIGDRGVLSSQRCGCGLPFPILKSINGRVSQRLVTRSGREIHDIFFVHTLAKVPGIAKFQVVQKSLDLVQVNLELEPNISREQTAAQTRDRLRELGDLGIDLAISFVSTIPLTSSGKLRHFISDVPSITGEKH